jgi:hypothetical protein
MADATQREVSAVTGAGLEPIGGGPIDGPLRDRDTEGVANASGDDADGWVPA